MSTFSVTRAANGQVVISLQNVEKHAIKGAGVVSGNAVFSLGHTSGGSSETVMQMGQTQDASCLKFEAEDAKNNFEFYGKNINAEFNKKSSTAYNVKWDAHNSSLDATKSNSSVIFEGGENSANNLIKLGKTSAKPLGDKYDNLIYDNGKNNTYIASADSTTRVETTKDSTGAVVKAGNGLNDFFIGGTAGMFIGGKSADNFITDKDTAKQNMMLGKDGDDVMTDFGQHSLFIGGSGIDFAKMIGKYGVSNLGFNEVGKFESEHGSENSVFTGEQQTDANGKVYNYKDILKLRGWNIEDFLAKSNMQNNPYYDLIKKEIEETLG